MVKNWVYIEHLYNNTWVYPIYNSLNVAIKDGKLKPFSQDLIDLSGFIATRIDMLPFIFARLNKGCSELYRELNAIKKSQISTHNAQGRSFHIKDDLKHELLIDIDAFLFELNASCELITKFLERLYNHLGLVFKEKEIGIHLRNLLREAEIDSHWFISLDGNRNYFVHEATPYFAVEIIKEGQFDLLIMKENLKEFNDSSKFIKISEFNKLIEGFFKTIKMIQEHIISTISRL